jgi:1-acyl-sn-glycerol-3-phosphate acyltransferase
VSVDDLSIPPAEALAPLSRFERTALRVAAAQNRGRAKRVWTAIGRQTGARAVMALTRRQLHIDGWEHIEAADHARPLLLLANHRTMLDFFVISALLYRKSPWMRAMHFPVRSRHAYEGMGGVMLNQLAACWSAFPPFFRRSDTVATDTWALDLLTAWCTEGAGRVIGFHPEGTRNKDADPWSLLPAQPGVGKLVHASRAQALPVFITGLNASIGGQFRDAWRGGSPIRVRVGAPLDVSALLDQPARARTYVEIGRAVMTRIAALAEDDRAVFAPAVTATVA